LAHRKLSTAVDFVTPKFLSGFSKLLELLDNFQCGADPDSPLKTDAKKKMISK
jgi:hypothetical protein